ncbi:beta strand repeat-containing protein [Methanobrevibacter sp. DSM 116169]|uniref:beta strand repeat-containing protein n=1 Tax=Methanobrevibacter sp. DSM 116169 TaxID=3242727 RepID=UPI0038FC3FE9
MINKTRRLITIALIISVLLLSLSIISAEEIINDDNVIDNDINLQNNLIEEISQEANTKNSVQNASGNFSNLQKAINDAGENGTVNLEGNITLANGEETTFLNGVEINWNNITILGNGYTIDGKNLVRIFTIESDNVTIKNLTLINGINENWGHGGAIYSNGDYLQLINMTFIGNVAISGGALGLFGNYGRIVDSKFYYNNAYMDYYVEMYGSGGAIFNNGNNLEIINSILMYNNASEGGAIYNEGHNISIYNTTLSYNNVSKIGASNRGGAIFNIGNAVTISDSILNNNEAGDGGAIFNYGGNDISNNPGNNFTIDGNTIIANNIAHGDGGGIYNHHGNNFLIYGNNLINNNSAVNGGGIYVYLYFGPQQNRMASSRIEVINNSFTIFGNNTISENTALENGGGIYFSSSIYDGYNYTFLMSGNNTITLNKAENGGGIYYINNVRENGILNLTITGSNNISKNNASYGGGALYYSYENNRDGIINVLINGSNNIDYNNAYDFAGGIYNNGYRNILINGSNSISYNNASEGGAIINDGGFIFIIGSNTINNNFADYGGAIINGYGMMFLNGTTLNNNIANNLGGAIANYGFEGNTPGIFSRMVIINSTFINNNAINGSAIYNSPESLIVILNSSFNGSSYLIFNDEEYDEHYGAYNGYLYLKNNTMRSDSVEKIYNLGFILSETHAIFLDNATRIVEVGSVVKIYGQITDDNGNIIVGQNLTFNLTGPNGVNIIADISDFENGHYYLGQSLIIGDVGQYKVEGYYDWADLDYQYNDYGILNSVEYLLNISKSTDVDSVNIGELIYYNVTITNDGSENATNVTVREYLPNSLSYYNYIGDNWNYNNLTGLWTYALNLAPGETIILTLIFIVNENALNSINNTVNITSDQYPFGRNATSNNTNLTFVNLQINKTTNVKIANVGDIISYTISIANNGLDNATGVVLSDYIPDGLTYVGFEGSGWNYTNGIWYYNNTLATGDIAEITLFFLITSQANRVFNNTANIASNETPRGKNATSNNTNVTFVELEASKTTESKIVTIGELIEYLITITNIGLDDATNIIVTDYIPEGLTYVDFDGDGWSYTNGKWIYNGTLSGNDTVILTLIFKVNEKAFNKTFNNTVNIASNEIPNGINVTSNNTDVTSVDTKITVNDVTGKPGEEVIIIGTLVTDNGDYINGEVILTLPDGSKVTVDVINGEFEYPWTIPEDFKEGTYSIFAEFLGNELYNPSNGTGVLTVIVDPTPGPTPGPTPSPINNDKDIVDAKTLNTSNMQKTANPIAILILALIISLIILPLKRRF